MGTRPRDRDPAGRPQNARPRDSFGRPLPYGAAGGVPRVPDDYAPEAGEAVAEAVRLLAERRPFHAHEVLEARWKTGPDDERDLWQGLAQICVGLTHLQRGNARGASALLARGAERVAGAGREPYGIATRSVAEAARRVAAGEDADADEAIASVLGALAP
ncbi:hypothetical protein SAMN05421505_10484 [Sinosporangium album]|uniref:DUF309 domain-containing protein n=1 Tax=Sinosporangium album TaxID=504805 RepID=A0A1G7U4D0_9ACTN|nr:DUF309 domain-containing protein [Sinosporangium album]SDG42121.1 hypothetical protein SAMN05421505_10484 [Sinosporangium album]